MNLRPMTAEEKQNLATPADLWRVLHAEFDFQIDACATAETNKCRHFIGPDHPAEGLRDAFSVCWIGGPDDLSAYCNPPFRNALRWHVKVLDKIKKERNDG